jgi:hypothetical protein
MDNLLKEAIADAKAVRETALENAKIALEEAFTPRLQSMLSKKIQSEMEKEGEHGDEEDVDERMHDEDEDDVEEMRLKAQDEDPSDEDSKDEDEVEEPTEEEEEDEVEERMHDEDEDEKKDEAMHDEDEDEVEERMKDEDEDEMDEDLDLDEILKELEAEAMHDEDEDDVEERMKDEDEDEEDKVDENDVSSAIGSADNKVDKKAGDSTDIGNADKAKHTESIDEDIDLDEVLKALSEEDEEEEEKESTDEVSKLESELAEHRDVVKYLRTKLNEVNLLNAKLLFTNKLFRAFGLSNDQKMKVVETFDRATNLREVKLVYSTLAESFGTKVEKKEIKESKGSASKAVASTKSKKQEEILSEGGELRNRFKKLAGII